MTNNNGITIDEFIQSLENYTFLEILDRMGILDFKEKNLCPFHSEKTPSMMIRKHFYICWGCKSKGSVIKFIQEIRGFSFLESVEAIANSLNIDVQLRNKNYTKVKDFGELYQKSLEFMRDEIESGNQVMIDFHEKLPSGGFFHPDYDWQDQFALSNRIALPIRSVSGKVVGFTARYLSDDAAPPKWKHSHNLPINYYLGTTSLKKLIMVEGPGDAEAILSKHLASGSDWTPVSCLGAHISLEQASLMKDREVVIMFDGDTAGRTGALQILRYNVDWRNISIATLAEGKDPGNITTEEFDHAMKTAEPLLDYTVERATVLMNTPDAVKHNRQLIIDEYAKRNGGLTDSEKAYHFPSDMNEKATASTSSLLRNHEMGSYETSIASRDVIYPLRLIATLDNDLVTPMIKIGEIEYKTVDEEGISVIAPLLDQTHESAMAILEGMYPDLVSQLNLGVKN